MIENNESPQVNEDIFNYDFTQMIKEKQIKRNFRNAALIVGIPYLICFAISYFWSKIYLLSASALGINLQEAIVFVNKNGINQLLQIFLSILLFTLPFILSVLFSGKTVSEVVKLSKPKEKSILPYFLLGFSFCLFANVAVSFAGEIFEGFGIEYKVDFGDNPSGIFGVLLSVISISIVPALVEEFAFRGVVFGVLEEFGESFALFTSSVLFGVMHGNFEQMPFAILVGLILGFLRIKTGSIWVPILLHFTNNLISVSIDYLNQIVSSNILNVFYSIFICFALVFFIPALYICEKRFKNLAFSVNKKVCELSEKEKYKAFFFSPVIIVSVSLYVMEAFRYFI